MMGDFSDLSTIARQDVEEMAREGLCRLYVRKTPSAPIDFPSLLKMETEFISHGQQPFSWR